MAPPTDDPSVDRTEVLDAHAVAELAQLDPDGRGHLLERVMATYLASLSRLMAELRQAQARGDLNAMRHAVHTLKSSSASVGARELSSLCAQAEMAVRESQLALLPDLLRRLVDEAGRVESAVRCMLPDPATTPSR